MTRVEFVVDAWSELSRAVEGQQRVLIVSDPSRRFVDRAEAALADRSLEVFDGAQVHVPTSVVEAARAAFDRFRPDAVVSVGGGAATGLAKMLRLHGDFRFVAVPTTYAGSEMTNIYGTTDGRTKRTGRDDRVQPDVVVYDPTLTATMPKDLTLQSLFNALAHPVSALSTGELEGRERSDALEAITTLVEAAVQLAQFPDAVEARMDALRGASAAGSVLNRGKLGLHHRIVHFLGGRFDVMHAGLHSVLLPHSLRKMQAEQPELYAEVERAAELPHLPHQIFDLLRRVGAAVSLRDLGVAWADLQEALQQASDLPSDLLTWAHQGRVPTPGAGMDGSWGLPRPACRSGSVEDAERVVVALHGRGHTADGIVRMARECVGHAPRIAIVAPQAEDNVWYPNSYRDSADVIGRPLQEALEQVERVLGQVRSRNPDAALILFGFSQGACLALETAARTEHALDGLVAIAGARIGPATDYAPVPRQPAAYPLVLGVAEADPWVDIRDVNATGAQFTEAGVDVQILNAPGDVHRIDARQRLAAAEVMSGQSLAPSVRGFGNTVESEALPGALPRRMNSPRRGAYDLYAEQVNATRFVADRRDNRRSWLYRVRPSAQTTAFRPLEPTGLDARFSERTDPNLQGWEPLPPPEAGTDFVDGLVTVAGAGHPNAGQGCAIHLYAANQSMDARSFCNADGELLLVPQSGELSLLTEFGILHLSPGRIGIVPRGLRFSVVLRDPQIRGYVAEVYGGAFRLPERGPVGANALTEARHFEVPRAWYEDRLLAGYRITHKMGGELFEATQDYSPYDAVAWHGNLFPCAYDLMDFSPVSNVRFDHADPSIYTVLTAPLDGSETEAMDFVFFPPRWDVTEETFRPPFFHRNATTEFNGIIRDPGADGLPFHAGGAFLTPAMTPHAVRARAVRRGMFRGTDAPHRTRETSMWFQFESSIPLSTTEWAERNRRDDWLHFWGGHRTFFQPEP